MLSLISFYGADKVIQNTIILISTVCINVVLSLVIVHYLLILILINTIVFTLYS